MSRYLCLDFGTKRIGVAASDESLTLATPMPFIEAFPFKPFISQLKKIILEKEVTLIVIGIPRNMDGSYGPAAAKAQEFVLRLKEILVVPIVTVDERLSTVEASRRLRESGKKAKDQKAIIDSNAARIILQSYLDAKSNFI